MKICKECGKEYEQGKHKRRSCPQCISRQQKKWRENNPEKVAKYIYNGYDHDRRKIHRERKKAIVDNYKLERGCKICGLKSPHPEVYDLHHRDPKEKEFSIASGYSNKAKRRVLAEMEKCDVLCANCHRLVHAGVINA